jgi:type IV pilus assembly protein PilM
MRSKVSIGLDIGSSAVRAAQVVVRGEKRTLQRFGQVGLPAGAVVEGEVQDRAAVAAAIKKLWAEGGFASKKVVLGLGSQRAMVRQVEMPPIPDAELRSALRFKISEFLPIPVEQAVVDFAPLPGAGGSGEMRRILLVAAQKDVVTDEVAAVEAAGLKVRAVDSSSLALLRGVREPNRPSDGGGGLEAVVGVGSQLITVAVRDGGVPRFVRTVALVGTATADLSEAGAIGPMGEVPRRGSRSTGLQVVPVEARVSRLDAIVGEVRSSLEYMLSQSHAERFERVLVTGGGAMLPGAMEALSNVAGLPVALAELPIEMDKKSLGLEDEALDEASYRWLIAAGLATWGTDAFGAPSLLPPEVLIRRQQRMVMTGAAGALAAVMLLLGGISLGKVHSANTLSKQIRVYGEEASALQVKIKGLGYVTEVPTEVKQRRAVASEALAGDIDWIGLLDRIAAALPASVTVQSANLIKTESTTVGATSAAVVPSTVVGNISMNAETTGGPAAVALFIDRISVVRGLDALWVSSTTKSTGVTTINASAQVTAAAFSTRAAHLPGGEK